MFDRSISVTIIYEQVGDQMVSVNIIAQKKCVEFELIVKM